MCKSPILRIVFAFHKMIIYKCNILKNMLTLVELDKRFLIENEAIRYANMKRNNAFCYLNHIISIFNVFIYKLKCK